MPAHDRQLLGPGFLDAKKYPEITFVSGRVKPIGKGCLEVTAKLSVPGVTRPVTLNVTRNKAGNYPMIDAPALGFGADAAFNRSTFGVGGACRCG